MTRHQVGWIPVLSGDSYALRHIIRASFDLPEVNPRFIERAKELLGRIEEVQDRVEQPKPPSDVWGVAV